MNDKPNTKSNENLPENTGDKEPDVLDFAATLKELRRHVDPKLVKQREGWRDRQGNVQMVDYVEWHTVADLLDDAAPGWSQSIKDIREIGEILTVTVAITIDGVTREGVGTGAAGSEMGIKKAEHDALKRAAVKFGVARDLYKKESEHIERAGSSGNERGFDINNLPQHPVARSLTDLTTSKQLGMIKAIARELGIDADEECQAHLECRTDELSKKAASWFIQYLQELQKGSEAAAAPVVPFRRGAGGPETKSGEVTIATKAKLLVEGGMVRRNAAGYVVTDSIGGKQYDFQITKTGDGVACTCGDYKTHAAKEPGYQCAHKEAVRVFVNATPSAAGA